MTATPITPAPVDQQVDDRGNAYDTTWLDGNGVRHYRRFNALGTAGGPADWSDVYFVNPICGDDLAARCGACYRCMDCLGCTCGR